MQANADSLTIALSSSTPAKRLPASWLRELARREAAERARFETTSAH
jgi:hypothetical protein